MSRGLLLLCALAVGSPARGAGLGIDLQGYPAGWVATGRLAFSAGTGEIALHAGYDATDRRDWGEHDDESGGGPGLGVAWRRPWRDSSRWVFGVRTDLWFLGIDWQEDGRRGRTDVIVLQPTLQVGHGWRVRERLTLVAHLGGGAEINVSTQGEAVGQGPILLLGMTASLAR